MEFRSLKDSFAILITFVMCPFLIVSMCSLQFWKLLLKLFGAYIEWVALRPFSFLSPNSMCSDDVYESDSAHEYRNAWHKCHQRKVTFKLHKGSAEGLTQLVTPMVQIAEEGLERTMM